MNDETLVSGLYKIIGGFGMMCDSLGLVFTLMPGQKIEIAREDDGLYLTFPETNLIEMIVKSKSVEQLIKRNVEKVE